MFLIFSAIRSHGNRNNNPKPDIFQSSLKTLIFNNFLAAQSMAGNVEEDDCEGALSNLQELLAHDVSRI